MEWKQFLKPDWRKIILFLIIAVFLSSATYDERGGEFPDSYFIKKGLPLPYEQVAGVAGLITIYAFLMIDILSWYLLSCVLISVFDKFKR